MTSIREIINEKYLVLEKELKKYVDISLFPQNIDTADLCFYISNLFLGIETDADYYTKVCDLIELNGVTISKNNMDTVVKLVVDFVKFFKNL